MEADFKELIPEFYFTNGDFLINNDKLELGLTSEGETIDDVILPGWAKVNKTQVIFKKLILIVKPECS